MVRPLSVLPAALGLVVALVGCGDSTKPDTTPPATITDLAVTAVGNTTATLKWTAPGDDGKKGRAAVYDLRVATFSVLANWDLATRVLTPPPGPAGTTDSTVVKGLEEGLSFNFAIRAQDQDGNWSGLSNMAEGVPRDTIPPAPVTDLAVRLETPISVVLSWTAPGDDGHVGMAFSYDVRYAKSPITEATWGGATPVEVITTPGVAGTGQELTIWPLQSQTVYYFALKTTDERENTSGLSNVAEIQTGTTHVWRILPDGTGDAPTVQAGIDSAGNGDLVLVEPGAYYENINLRGKEIHLKGDAGPEVTILDGTYGDSSVVVCDSGETNRTIIEGLTITHGKGSIQAGGRLGAGILCLEAAPVIRGNIVRDNRAASQPGASGFSWGGGILAYSSTEVVIIEDNVIENNFTTGNGGGLVPGACIIRRNVIRGNSTSEGDGGGIRLGDVRATIQDNLFLENVAGDHGGGIYVTNTHAIPALDIDVAWNLFLSNQAEGKGGVSDCSGGAMWVEGGAHVHQNTIAFNDAEGQSYPAGGGICLLQPTSDALIERNILFNNGATGLVASQFVAMNWGASVCRNLFFNNNGYDIYNGFPETIILNLQENLFSDPIFCIIGSDSRGELAGISPALNQRYGVIGAVGEPGCGPYAGTWGSIRRLMRSEDGSGGRP